MDNEFCKAVVSSGYLTWDQMIEAALAYRIGATRQGGVIFWQIGKDDYVNDGKVMYYRPDCHRDKARCPTWVSYMLCKRQKTPLTGAGARHCLFGAHLLAERRYVTTVARAAIIALLRSLKEDYPNADICGHRELKGVHKDCPCFDCQEYRDYFAKLPK